MDEVYNLQNIGVYYRKAAIMPWKSNKFFALHDVSFKIHRGQTIGIIGRNGAGKSTLLKIMAGIILPDTGSIYRADSTVSLQSLGAGFDQRLTGRQNILLNGLLLGMEKRYIIKQMNDIVALADIGDFIDEPIKHYSSGMQARLGFSIAYYVNTDIILIDEALATGDQAFKLKATELIKDKIKSDHTVVLVTHSVALVSELCDRVIQIENGRSLPELSVQESINRYLKDNRKLKDV